MIALLYLCLNDLTVLMLVSSVFREFQRLIPYTEIVIALIFVVTQHLTTLTFDLQQ